MTPVYRNGPGRPHAATLNLPLHGLVVHLAIASQAVQRLLAFGHLFGVDLRCEMYRTEAIA